MSKLTVQQAIDALTIIGLTSPDPALLVEHEYQGGVISGEKHTNLIDDINKGYKIMGGTPTVVPLTKVRGQDANYNNTYTDLDKNAKFGSFVAFGTMVINRTQNGIYIYAVTDAGQTLYWYFIINDKTLAIYLDNDGTVQDESMTPTGIIVGNEYPYKITYEHPNFTIELGDQKLEVVVTAFTGSEQFYVEEYTFGGDGTKTPSEMLVRLGGDLNPTSMLNRSDEEAVDDEIVKAMVTPIGTLTETNSDGFVKGWI